MSKPKDHTHKMINIRIIIDYTTETSIYVRFMISSQKIDVKPLKIVYKNDQRYHMYLSNNAAYD